MPDQPYRVLAIASHPVQYASANFREMARHPQLDLTVAYCTLRGAEAGLDPEFGANFKWDVPLLDGYKWMQVESSKSPARLFQRARDWDLWKIVRDGEFDAIINLTGYKRLAFWISRVAGATRGVPFFFGTDTSTLQPRDGRRWKVVAKKLFWPLLFRLASQVIVVSTPGRELMESLSIPSDRIALLPYTVDNDWWTKASAAVDRKAVRDSWGISANEKVILFCAKFQEWKRPLDLLRAFANSALAESVLLMVGEGPLRPQLEKEAVGLGLGNRVRFSGFLNQSQLPPAYTSADLMVLPSSYEPFGLVVNEAMLCGCPVAVSDRVGAARDLVAPVAPDFVFPHGDVEALSALLRRIFFEPQRLLALRQAARARMQTWSPRENVAAVFAAVDRATAGRRKTVTDSLRPGSVSGSSSRGSHQFSE